MGKELKEILKTEGSVRIDRNAEVTYGQDQAFVTRPVVYPTVGFGLEACDALWELADAEEKAAGYDPVYGSLREGSRDNWYDFFIGLNGYNESHVDSCISVSVSYYGGEYDGPVIRIDLDREEQDLMFGMLDRECRRLYGKTALEMLEEAGQAIK